MIVHVVVMLMLYFIQ